MTNENLNNIPKEKFEFVQRQANIHDKKLDTKPIGYFKDAWLRFKRNKSSVTAALIILVLLLFAIFVPFFSNYTVDFRDGNYKNALPKNNLLAPLGIWDGTKEYDESEGGYDYYNALGVESGYDAVKKVVGQYEDQDGNTRYVMKIDTYFVVGYTFCNVSAEEYQAIQDYQNKNNVQVIYPMTENYKVDYNTHNGANFWYKLKDPQNPNTKGVAVRDGDGNYIPDYKMTSDEHKYDYNSLRIDGDDGANGKWYQYAVKNQTGYKIRVNYYEYFKYLNGDYPSFLFGTNGYGQDILVCLAQGARLSFLLAIFVSAINLTIGAFYGAVEGYYGGAIDLILERVSDVLASVPFIIVATLFQLHLREKVGVLPSLLFAFVLTGWVGMAARVRMQFYRFKSQEYILAARTLGAKDSRLMFKHIFPNAIGTIITGSILAIPGVIFTESSLSYLNIINLETSSLTSIGTMLAQGQGSLMDYPHIIMFPALFISLLEISFNLFGNGLRDAFNPSLRGSEE